MTYLNARLPCLLVKAAAAEMLIVLVLVSGVWRSTPSYAQSSPPALVGQIQVNSADIKDLTRRVSRFERWLDSERPDAKLEGLGARMDGFDRRLDTIEKIGYAIFAAVIAQLIASGVHWNRRT